MGDLTFERGYHYCILLTDSNGHIVDIVPCTSKRQLRDCVRRGFKVASMLDKRIFSVRIFSVEEEI